MAIVCKICTSGNTAVYTKSGIYKLYRCFSCNVVFIHPQPTYKNISLNNQDKYNSLLTERAYFAKKDELSVRALNDVKKILKYKKSGRILDIGCSYGFYLAVFKKYGFKTFGIDITPRAIEYARDSLHLNVYKGDFMNYNFNKKFNVVTVYDLIEHLPDPIKLMKRIKNILNKNGLIVVQTPNIDSLISKITGNKWFWLLAPQHLFLYSVGSIKRLLESNGFEILEITTWDDYDEFIKNILYKFKLKDKGKAKYLYYAGFKLLLLLKPLAKLWAKYDLGGEITVYAKK